jgi:hypothetical protein
MREIVILLLAICLPTLFTDLTTRSIDVDARGNPLSDYRENQPYDYLRHKSAEREPDRLRPEVSLSPFQQDALGGDGSAE